MKTSKIIAAALVAAAIAAGTWGYFAQDGGAAPHLINRPWVDRLTEGPKDKMNVIFLGEEEKIGVTVHGSQFRHLINVLKYDLSGDSLEIVSLQDGIRIRTQVRTWKCDDAPGHLDLCMELKVRHRKVRFYSHTDWESEGHTPDALQNLPLTPPTHLPEIDGADIRDGEPSWFKSL